MTYTISIINHYSYPLDAQKRIDAYEEHLLCYGYSAYVKKYPTLPFDEYINDVIVNIGANIDITAPQYSYNTNTFTPTKGTKIDNKTAPPLLFSWWNNKLKETGTIITGDYHVHISFSSESNNVTAVKLKKLCDTFLIENSSRDDVNSGTYYGTTKPERLNYEGLIDKIADLYPTVGVWKFNGRIADDFMDKVEKQIKSSPNYKSILITKLFNKL